MNAKKLTISPTKPIKRVLDYNALRELGMAYIESLGSDYWTDYNAHDPGITTLEALCYALSELGYRMQFAMADLLEQAPEEPLLTDSRFTARQILTTKPVTVLDYRRMLIDLPGVANAWLRKVNNPKPHIFGNCETKKLTFDKTKYPMQIMGFWDVLLELENDEQFGNLNASGFEYLIAEGTKRGKRLEFVVHQRPNLNWSSWLNGVLNTVTIVHWKKEKNTQWSGKLTLEFDTDEGALQEEIAFTLYTRGWQEPNPDQALKNVIKKTGQDALIDVWLKRERRVLDILNDVNTSIQANRNLCEDFREITLVSAEEVSFCADIEANPDADLEELEAKIILAIENYLSPEPTFYALKQLLDKGMPTEDIFDGPALTHGFLLEADVAKSALKGDIYTSDIINLILDIEGIETVSNFVMSKFDAAGKLLKKAEPWALKITPNHKPRYAYSKSSFIFHKNQIPFATRDGEVQDILELLKAEVAKTKLLSRQVDIEVPKGKYRELDKYFTVQNDFPPTYGIGELGLPANAGVVRKNQAKQLQGYLQFFDQVLANFLAQVEGYKQYIALDDNVEHTYFSKYLEDIPGGDDLYADRSALQAALPGLAENEEQYVKRKNAVLDHLLSRFQESFNNYVLMLYGDGDERNTGKDLIADKIAFLTDYPEMSARRFTALDITQAAYWPYSPSAGLKERVSKLAGIYNEGENYLLPIRIELKQQAPAADDKWEVLWKDREDDQVLFKLATPIVGENEADLANRKSFQLFVEGGGSVVSAGSKFRVIFGNEATRFISVSTFNSKPAAQEFLNHWYKSLAIDAEGMFLFEHILLRPKNTNYVLMDTCLPDDCKPCGSENPYNFKLSIILPYWPNRFRKMPYRKHIEELVHTETPAHILPKVCWADPLAWQELEDAWQQWLEANQGTNNQKKKNATARLIGALENVETVYPEAVLHDCEDDKDENPVILNQTRLGIF